jgi:integrase
VGAITIAEVLERVDEFEPVLTKPYASLWQTGTREGVRLLTDYMCRHKRWRKICKEAELTDLKFHDLRKTFGSLLAQNGISTAVTQKLLEHSSPNLTNKVYTNIDPVLRHAIEQLPVGDWL